MKITAHCAAVVPCFNEAETIAPIITATLRNVAAVIVVDDGSTDETAALAERAGAIVVQHDQRQGKGAALKSGLRLACERGFQWAFTMDGDGQHSPEDIAAFFECAKADGTVLVVGNRMGDDKKMPLLRRWVNRGMSVALSRMAGQRLPDSQCGFRLLNLNVWTKLQTQASHFEFESELLLAFARAGHTVRFVPVQVIYQNERSKICPLRDTVRWLRWWRQALRAA